MGCRHLFLVGYLLAATQAAGDISAPLNPDLHLTSSHEELSSRHFLLHFPKDLPAAHAQKVLDSLESEFARLTVWIPSGQSPSQQPQHLEVVIYHPEDFERRYGPAIIGLYDGKIRAPLSEWNGRPQVLASTLTHELVHALVTEVTRYGAPYWLHEGLAQYLELDHRFPDPKLMPRGQSLSLIWLDEILANATDPELLDQAYRESVWVVHFLGQTYGISGIRRLLRTYARWRDTDRVVQEALKVSKADLRQAYKTWSRVEAPQSFRQSRNVLASPGNLLSPDGMNQRRAVRHLRKMKDWYSGYAKRVLPFKTSLRRVVESLRKDPAAPPVDSCRQMTRDLAALLEISQHHVCPHEDIQYVLLDAFRTFQDLGTSCRLGQTDRMWSQLDSAEASLQISASLLAPYGLEP